MDRRVFLAAGGLAASAAVLPVAAQVAGLGDAVNKAGRQRMLSQRMSKAYLALAQKVAPSQAGEVMDRSIALFDRQLAELKSFAPNAALRDAYAAQEVAWSGYKAALVGVPPSREGALELLRLDDQLLALAHSGTVLYEKASGKAEAHLVNLAGRQRMLSQRMAKFYLAAALQVEAAASVAEIAKARKEFVDAMAVLRKAPQANARIQDEIALADQQWVFFDMALQKLQPGGTAGARQLSEAFVTSENLLAVMDRVTTLFTAAT